MSVSSLRVVGIHSLSIPDYLLLAPATMRLSTVSALCLFVSAATANVVKRAAQFTQGQPIDGNGKGGPILGEIFLGHWLSHYPLPTSQKSCRFLL